MTAKNIMEQEPNEELLMRVQQLQQESEEIEKNLHFVAEQINELEKFSSDLGELSNQEKIQSLSYLGKGVYLETEVKNKTLFVEVGSGIVVRKTLQEANQIIKNQIEKFREMRSHFLTQISSYKNDFNNILKEIKTNQQ